MSLALNMLFRMVVFYLDPDYKYINAVRPLIVAGQRTAKWMGLVKVQDLKTFVPLDNNSPPNICREDVP